MEESIDVCVEAYIEPDNKCLEIWDIRGDSRSTFFAENIEKVMVEPTISTMLSIKVEGGGWTSFVPYTHHTKVKQVRM